MKHLLIRMGAIVLCTMALSYSLSARQETHYQSMLRQDRALIQQHLYQLPVPFPARCSTKIQNMILQQMHFGKKEIEAILGRAAFYFPIFEHYLQLHDLPDELKYIPFVESRLKIDAISSNGAAGLWQFMDYTAKHYRLRVDEKVDERLDPLKSTESAVCFLSDLYGEFGDWLLVLAAYNCGPGRVKKAIHLAKSNNYWALEKYLPKQTQHYIPAYIAAIYIAKHAEKHQLEPTAFKFEIADMCIIKMYETLSFQTLQRLSNLPFFTLKELNPAYQQEIIPANRKGNYLLLPRATADKVKWYLTEKRLKKVVEIQLSPRYPTERSVAADFPELHQRGALPDSAIWQFSESPERFFHSRLLAYIPRFSLR